MTEKVINIWILQYNFVYLYSKNEKNEYKTDIY